MNPRKKVLLTNVFSATRDPLTIVRNIENIVEWMEHRDTSVFKHIRQGYILLPGANRILDQTALKASIPRDFALSHYKCAAEQTWSWSGAIIGARIIFSRALEET